MSRLQARRRFLTALPALPLVAAPAQPSPIAAVEMIRFSGRRQYQQGVDAQYIGNPIHIYAEHRPQPYRDNPNPATRETGVSALYLSIKTTDGLEGFYGPVDSECVPVIERQLKPFLLGKDALAVETLWDKMYRSNRHARVGHMMMAISAVDNALWDLRGRYFKTPVYRLLGGPGRASIEAYGSCLGFAIEPALAARKAVELRNEGYRCQKWFLAYGPGDGREGLKKNVDLALALREAAGEAVEFMFDAFMAWNLDYALEWCKRVEPMRPRWIEEAFPPDRLEAFIALRKQTSVPVATGEHFYNRWEAQRFLAAGAISVCQADPEWCGGVSELTKICHLGSLYDAQVVPHGHSIHAALHVVAAQSPATCPLVENLITKMRWYYFFERDWPEVRKGHIELNERPGFGILIDESKVEKKEIVKP